MRNDKPMKAIAFGTRKITYNLHHQDRKRMRIVVSPELTVDAWYRKRAHETLGRYMAKTTSLITKKPVTWILN